MKNLKDLTYGIVGLGIMGGSIAKAIRERILCRSGAEGKIYVCNRSTACLTQALAEGIADKAFTSAEYEKMLPECDFVYVCLYPQATIDFLEKHKHYYWPVLGRAAAGKTGGKIHGYFIFQTRLPVL